MKNEIKTKINSSQAAIQTYRRLGMQFFSSEILTPDVCQQHKPDIFEASLYSVTVVMKGSGRFNSGCCTFEIIPKFVFYTSPQNLRKISWTDFGQAYHFNFNASFMKMYAGTELLGCFPFLLSSNGLSLLPEDARSTTIFSLAAQIHKESQTDSLCSRYIVANLLMRMLLVIRVMNRYVPSVFQDIRTQDCILTRFIEDLEHHFENIQTGKAANQIRVGAYARSQGLNENYFTRLIKFKSGKTTNQWIAEKIFVTAVHMIRHSSMSNKEIAFRLGFHYPSHFSSFFKKWSGLSPRDYRKLRSM